MHRITNQVCDMRTWVALTGSSRQSQFCQHIRESNRIVQDGAGETSMAPSAKLHLKYFYFIYFIFNAVP